MLKLLISMFRCTHANLSFPQTDPQTQQTTTVCTDCGARFAYSWEQMRRGERVDGRAA